jgi:hypothetical protein
MHQIRSPKLTDNPTNMSFNGATLLISANVNTDFAPEIRTYHQSLAVSANIARPLSAI